MGLNICFYVLKILSKKKYKNLILIVFEFLFPTRAINYNQEKIFLPIISMDILIKSHDFYMLVDINRKKFISN